MFRSRHAPSSYIYQNKPRAAASYQLLPIASSPLIPVLRLHLVLSAVELVEECLFGYFSILPRTLNQ